MTKCKTAVTTLLMPWSYCSLVLSHRHIENKTSKEDSNQPKQCASQHDAGNERLLHPRTTLLWVVMNVAIYGQVDKNVTCIDHAAESLTISSSIKTFSIQWHGCISILYVYIMWQHILNLSNLFVLTHYDDRSLSTLAQVMVSCPVVSIHCLNQWWPITIVLQWHSTKTNLVGIAQAINSISHRVQWVNIVHIFHSFLLNVTFFSIHAFRECYIYHQTSNISHTTEGSKIVDHSDVVGASPVSAAPTISSLWTPMD